MLYLVLAELTFRSALSADQATTDDNLAAKALPQFDLTDKTWPLFSAALFALYPLHPEAVSWITGRVDTIVTMFFFASLWLYLRNRRTGSRISAITSLVFFVCALMSKEMAIIEPAVLVALEFLLPTPHTVKKRLSATWTFWLTLSGYFLVRRLALGTFIGGYDDSLQSDPSSSLSATWPHALRMIFVPFNAELFRSDGAPKIIWTVLYIFASALSVGKCILGKALRPLGLFLVVWFFLSLVPVFKLLNIGSDLEGSRLAYLSTGPLCAFICFGLMRGGKFGALGSATLLAKALLLGLLALSYLALIKNNQPWQEAGMQSRAIVTGLDQLYSNSTTNTPTYLLQLPDTVHGAYLIRNAIDGMTKPPQISREAKQCFVLNNFDPVFPFGFSKNNLIEDKESQARAFIWDYDEKRFQPYPLPSRTDPFAGTWSKDQLKALVINTPADDRRLTFRFKSLPCWNTDFVVFRLASAKSPEDLSNLSLNYTNDLCPLFSRRNRVPCTVRVVDGKPEVTFRLHGEIDWSFGNTGHELTILSSKPIDFSVDQLRFEGPEKHLPKLSMKETGNQNRSGFVRLSSQSPTCKICYDVRDLPGAVGVQLEATKPNKFFPVHNSPEPSRDLGFVRGYSARQGELSIKKEDFAKDGIYEVRIRALDGNGKPVGFASDHLLVNVSD
jgi:hypothetical protein